MLRRVSAELLSLCRISGCRSFATFTDIPVVDISPLVTAGASDSEQRAVGKRLHDACVSVGFFYVTNHGVLPISGNTC